MRVHKRTLWNYMELFEFMEESFLYVLYCLLITTHGIHGSEDTGKIHFTNSWAVHIENGSDVIASEIAEKHGFHNFGQVR